MSLPETTSEDRRHFYEDLERLLTPGFIHHPVMVNGARLVLRNPTRADLFLTNARADSPDTAEWQQWWVASCVWLVNGQNILGEPQAAYLVYQELRHLPVKSFIKIFWTLMGLRNRFTRALRALESFCFESFSRQKWHSLNGHSLASEETTGVPGTSKLGGNIAQQLWVAYNVLEDARLQDERQWLMLRATMSPHLTKKSWNQILSTDKSTNRRRNDDRQREQDLFYYRSIRALEWDEDFVDLQGPARFKRKSVKDLQGEFYRWVAGEKDEHDLAVEAHKRRIRQGFIRAQKRREARQKKVQELFAGQSGVTSRVKMMGYTPEQLAELLEKRRPGQKNVAQIHDPSKSEYLYGKYMEEDPSVGALEVRDGVLHVHEDRRETLQSHVANRRLAPDLLDRWE